MIMTRTRAKNRCQRSGGSEVRVETNKRTDGHDRVATFPSNAVSDETRAVGHRRIPFSARIIHVGRIIACTYTPPHTHTRLMALFQDYPGEPVPVPVL